MEYKKDDKVVFKIDGTDASNMNKGLGPNFWNSQLLGKLEDFQFAEKKIKMTAEEKEEFDDLGCHNVTLRCALSEINIVEYPHLYIRLFESGTPIKNNKAQLEFSRAWEKPSRIEVVKEKKYKIKILNGYLYNVSRNLYKIADRINYGDIFTQSEIDELQKQEQFKAIDLNQCKDEVKDENE